MLRRAMPVLFLSIACLASPVLGQETGACIYEGGCIITNGEECYDLCGCFCPGLDCEEQLCFCDAVVDPDVSYAQPWDDYGRVFVTPGSQSAAGEVEVAALYQAGACLVPVEGADIEIDFSNCPTLCIDSADDGLHGITGPDGTVVMNPRVGGCEECLVLVRASGVTIAAPHMVVSTDWDGARADGRVGSADFAFFTTAFKQTQDTCADYNGDGEVSGTDFSLFSASFKAGDHNEGACE